MERPSLNITTEQAHALVDILARLIEMAGVAIIVAGIIISTLRFAFEGSKRHGWRDAYARYRSNLGRGILLGLELLVGADIISTITAPTYPRKRRTACRDRRHPDFPQLLTGDRD